MDMICQEVEIRERTEETQYLALRTEIDLALPIVEVAVGVL